MDEERSDFSLNEAVGVLPSLPEPDMPPRVSVATVANLDQARSTLWKGGGTGHYIALRHLQALKHTAERI